MAAAREAGESLEDAAGITIVPGVELTHIPPPLIPGMIARARELVARRMRVDWRAAVRADGNPYKRDFKRGSTETALGDLVRAYRDHGSRSIRTEVWNGLRTDIEALAKELPGIHPRLRKYMKRLARRIG